MRRFKTPDGADSLGAVHGAAPLPRQRLAQSLAIFLYGSRLSRRQMYPIFPYSFDRLTLYVPRVTFAGEKALKGGKVLNRPTSLNAPPDIVLVSQRLYSYLVLGRCERTFLVWPLLASTDDR
jgi:hypothetical protein